MTKVFKYIVMFVLSSLTLSMAGCHEEIEIIEEMPAPEWVCIEGTSIGEDIAMVHGVRANGSGLKHQFFYIKVLNTAGPEVTLRCLNYDTIYIEEARINIFDFNDHVYNSPREYSVQRIDRNTIRFKFEPSDKMIYDYVYFKLITSENKIGYCCFTLNRVYDLADGYDYDEDTPIPVLSDR